jgi:hypothetical protein
MRTLAVLLVLWGGQSGQSQPQRTPVETIQLTLTRQTPWQGLDGWCSFGIELVWNGGGVSWRCGVVDPVEPASRPVRIRRRELTAAERQTLRRLYEAARLFDGGHVGADLSASDPGFEMLIVRTDRRAVALVTFGNATFASGPRKALIDWMRQLQTDLLRACNKTSETRSSSARYRERGAHREVAYHFEATTALNREYSCPSCRPTPIGQRGRHGPDRRAGPHYRRAALG